MTISRVFGNWIAPAAILSLLIVGMPASGQEPGLTPRVAAGHPVLAIGAPAPDFALPGIDGKIHKLSDYKKSPYLMVMFICNHCPTSQLYEGRMKKLVADYKDKGVTTIAIQPNDPSAIRLSELGYTDVSDSLQDMKIRAAYRHFNFPYLYDGETQSISNAFGVVATPHIFIFDKDRKLQYEGRIDDRQRESLVKNQDTRAALDALLAGKPVTVTHTPAFGCSTKWKSKIDGQAQERKMVESEAVKLEPVTADDLKKLRANATTKVTVVSFWSTGCQQCISDLTPLLETFRMFRRRDFGVVTVAMNPPADQAAVQKVLESNHASSRNLQVAADDVHSMQTAFDARWDPVVPFTMVIAPGGRVIYSQEGPLDTLEFRRAILANLENDTYMGHPAYWAMR